MNLRPVRSPAASIYLLVCFVVFFWRRLRLRHRGAMMMSLPRAYRPKGRRPSFITRGETPLPRDCRPKGRSPSFARVVPPYSPAEGTDRVDGLWPSASSKRSAPRPQNHRWVPADHAPTQRPEHGQSRGYYILD